MPYGFMYSGSAWHVPHIRGTFVRYTIESVSDFRRISCLPWQEVHTATRVSFFSNRSTPCRLVLYSANWSVLRLYCLIMATSEWQRAQKRGISFHAGFPRNPYRGLIASSPGRNGFPP